MVSHAMVNRAKIIGTRAESAVVKVLRDNGWPAAERRALTGGKDQGDITGTPGIAWEVKGGEAAKTVTRGNPDKRLADWLEQTETERLHASAHVGVLVLAREGIGPERAGKWPAILPMTTVLSLASGGGLSLYGRWPAKPIVPVRMDLTACCRLLRLAGYGSAP
jgi:hypothetical protein